MIFYYQNIHWCKNCQLPQWNALIENLWLIIVLTLNTSDCPLTSDNFLNVLQMIVKKSAPLEKESIRYNLKNTLSENL